MKHSYLPRISTFFPSYTPICSVTDDYWYSAKFTSCGIERNLLLDWFSSFSSTGPKRHPWTSTKLATPEAFPRLPESCHSRASSSQTLVWLRRCSPFLESRLRRLALKQGRTVEKNKPGVLRLHYFFNIIGSPPNHRFPLILRSDLRSLALLP